MYKISISQNVFNKITNNTKVENERKASLLKGNWSEELIEQMSTIENTKLNLKQRYARLNKNLFVQMPNIFQPVLYAKNARQFITSTYQQLQ